jgi:hypothetical protein
MERTGEPVPGGRRGDDRFEFGLGALVRGIKTLARG